MKIVTRFAAFVMSALVMFSACQKEQTSLSLDDITQKAKVTGTIVYPNSYELGADNVVSLATAPVDSASVVVKVATSSFSNSNNWLTVTTYTNSKGEYSVEVPAADGGTTVKIQAVSFNGTQKYLKEVKGGELVWDEKTGVFSTSEKEMTVYPGQTVSNDVVYTFTEQNLTPNGTVEGQARIMGTLTYNAGQAWSAGEGFTEQILPAAKVQIVVSDNGKEYSVITDENGHYDITIPVTRSQTVTLTPQSFMGTHSELKDVQNGEYVFETKDCVYSAYSQVISINKGSISNTDIKYNYSTINAEKTLDKRLPLKIKVGMGVPSGIEYYMSRSYYGTEKIGDETYKVYKATEYNSVDEYEGIIKAAKNIDVVITVNYPDGFGTRKYGATTDSNGNISIDIPAFEDVWNTTIQIEAQGFVYKDSFKYYLPTDEYVEDDERREVNEEDKEINMIKALKVQSVNIPGGNGVYEQYSSKSFSVNWTEYKEFVPQVKLYMTYRLKVQDADKGAEIDSYGTTRNYSYVESFLNSSYSTYFNDKF